MTVSVVVPVYNAMPYLPELLDSLAAQDLPADAFNVIAVDDGSTDGSADVLRQYASRYGNVEVIHQANSGAPGAPRNAGLRASHADYVFFADADDIVASGCLRRLLGFAEEHGSDIVIPKLTPLAGRSLPTRVYEKTVIDADLVTAFGTLFPQKLYRRRLLSDHAILFPEGRMHLEDGIFNALAYTRARRISILGDGTYYMIRARDDRGNFSGEALEPEGYTWAVSEICRIVLESVGGDVAQRIVSNLYQRKCLNMYQPERFRKLEPARQDAWLQHHGAFAERFISADIEHRLASPSRERSYFVRRGDKAGLMAHLACEHEPMVKAELLSARWVTDGIAIAAEAAIEGRLELSRQLYCEIRRRDGDGASAFPLVRRAVAAPGYGEPAIYDGILPTSSIRTLLPGPYDLYLAAGSERDRLIARLRWKGAAAAPPARLGFEIYRTRQSNVGIRKSPEGVLRSLLRRMSGWTAGSPGEEEQHHHS